MMATLYARTAGGTWTTASTWSTTSESGGAAGAAPTASDTCLITALSGNLTMGIGSVCLNANFTGYTRTITWGTTASLTISGTLTLSPTMTTNYTGTGSWILSGNSATSIQTNGYQMVVPVQFNGGTGSVTLLDTMVCQYLNLAFGTTNVTILGSFGFDVRNELKLSTADCSGTINLAAGTNYKTNKFTDLLSRGDTHAKIISGTPGTRANLNITGDMTLGYLDFTDIAANGRTISTFNGVLSNCNNIVSFTDAPTGRQSASAFIF